MPEAGQKDRKQNKANADTNKESSHKKSKLFARYVAILNYICVEHAFLSSIFILGLGFIAIAIQMHYGTVTPRGWAVIGVSVVGSYVIMAGVWMAITWSKPTQEEIEEKHREETAQAIADVSNGLQAIQKDVAEQGKKIEEIDKRSKPRRIEAAQMAVVVARISSFRGLKIFIPNIEPDNSEAGVYRKYFISLFRTAGWNVTGDGTRFVSGESVSGLRLTIDTLDVQGSDTINAAFAIGNVLMEFGLIEESGIRSQDGIGIGTIFLEVGQNPNRSF